MTIRLIELLPSVPTARVAAGHQQPRIVARVECCSRTRLRMPQPSLTTLLNLTSPPVAITFVEVAPVGVPHVASGEPAGCGYWRRAAAGEVFYTDENDHKRCPVGAHTHGVKLSAAE